MKGERTCIGCRAKSSKREMHRIVRRPDGSVRLDAGSKEPGRGAYVCSQECLHKAIKTGRLASALRARLTEDDFKGIVASPVWASGQACTDGEE